MKEDEAACLILLHYQAALLPNLARCPVGRRNRKAFFSKCEGTLQVAGGSFS